MRVLVCGGRDFTDAFKLAEVMREVCSMLADGRDAITEIIHGGCRGADALAGQWAATRRIPVRVFPADWKLHGKAAGAIRNQQMLTEGKPHIVVVMPGGRGTADMCKRAKKCPEIQVIIAS